LDEILRHASVVFQRTSDLDSFSVCPVLASTKSVIAVTKLSTFEMSLNAISKGSDGYEKPNAAQAAKTMKNPAREKRVYFDSLVRGENVRKDMVESSTRKRGRKKSSRKIIGAGGMGGYILFRTMRSNGS
jgi:hypothetical protein